MYICVARIEKANQVWKTKPQAVIVISLWVCGKLSSLNLFCVWPQHNKPPEIWFAGLAVRTVTCFMSVMHFAT